MESIPFTPLYYYMLYNQHNTGCRKKVNLRDQLSQNQSLVVISFLGELLDYN